MIEQILADPVTALLFAVVLVFSLMGVTVTCIIWLPMAFQYGANVSRNIAENNSQAGRRLDDGVVGK